MNLLGLVPDVIKIPASMVLGAGLAFYPIKWYGAAQEKNRAEVAALTRTVEVIRDRQITDAAVAASSNTDVCRFMGLSVEDNAECMRRVAQVNPVAEHVSGDNPDGPSVCEPSGGPQRIRR